MWKTQPRILPLTGYAERAHVAQVLAVHGTPAVNVDHVLDDGGSMSFSGRWDESQGSDLGPLPCLRVELPSVVVMIFAVRASEAMIQHDVYFHLKRSDARRPTYRNTQCSNGTQM